jgi:hypothetical protein
MYLMKPSSINNLSLQMFHTDTLSSRIGPTHGLSLLPAAQSTVPTNRGRPTDAVAATLPYNRPNFNSPPGNAYNSLPSHAIPSDDEASYGGTRFGNGLADEFGSAQAIAATKPVIPPSVPPTVPPTTSSPAAIRRPDSSGGGGNRFTVTNLQPHDIPQSTSTASRQLSTNATGSGPSSGIAQQKWPRAEDEKKKLFDDARAKVIKVQGIGSTPVCSFCDPCRRYFSYCILHIGACHCYQQSFYSSSSIFRNSSASRSCGWEQNNLDVGCRRKIPTSSGCCSKNSGITLYGSSPYTCKE